MFNLKEVSPDLFLLSFDDPYDAPLYFMRLQEFYEAPNLNFKGQPFEMMDYIKAHHKKGKFSYLADWDGFNIPNWVFDKLYKKGIPDENKYDRFMKSIYEMIRVKVKGDKFYLIGCAAKSKEVINHEIAHGLWYLSSEYRAAQERNMASSFSDPLYGRLRDALAEIGYSSSGDVMSDEIQAYCSTGLSKELEKVLDKHCKNKDEMLKKFNATFKKHNVWPAGVEA